MIQKIIITTSIIIAQNTITGQTIDQKSKKIIDAVTQKYNNQKNNYFKFTFSSGTNGKISKTEQGTYYSEGNKYKLKIIGTEQIYDGQKIYNINQEDQEITIAKPNENQNLFSPITYINSYRKNFNTTYAGQININGTKAEYIKLTPIKKTKLSVVKLFINPKNNSIIKLEQHGTNKDIAIITITEHKANQNLSNDTFTFNKNKYNNYIITEL